MSPYYNLIEDNQLIKFLKAQSYKSYHVGSYWSPTIKNDLADVNLRLPRVIKLAGLDLEISSFSSIVINKGILPKIAAFMQHIGLSFLFKTSNSHIHAESYLYQTDALKQIAGSNDEQPKFVFAHTLMPHPPFVFDANGQPAQPGPKDGQYIEQLKFTNKKIKEVVEVIMKHSRRQAIIVLQADEGPYPNSQSNGTTSAFSWPNATVKQLRRKTGILNAIYVPDKGLNFYETLSPVNTWRLIFNQYFGTKLEHLSDRHYTHKNSNSSPYFFYDITDRIAH